MNIKKGPTNRTNYIFDWVYFNSARNGFKEILKLKELEDKKILLPAYIGFSTKEGSGVFDPIREVGNDYIFYRLDKKLRIDIIDLKKKISEYPGNILLIIDYFGFADRNIKVIKKYAVSNNMVVVEDFAHSFFSFIISPVIDFDYGVFSIHKLFPTEDGGLVLQKERSLSNSYIMDHRYNLFRFNYTAIIKRRCDNYDYIKKLLQPIWEENLIDIISPNRGNSVPQSFPILLADNNIRDHVYFYLNKKGYGVVSLYHTIISEVNETFANELEISRRILNLPIHQDVEKRQLDEMLEILINIVRYYKKQGKLYKEE